MTTSLVTPDTFYERLLGGEYDKAAHAKKALARAGTKWNKVAKERAMSHLVRFFEKGKEGMPPTFWPSKAGEVASDKKAGKKSKRAPVSTELALPNEVPSSALAAEVMKDDQLAFAHTLYGQGTQAALSYLTHVVGLHVDVIDAFALAKNVDENVDTSEVQGVVNSLSQVAALVSQETQRGIGVLLKHLPTTRTPVNNGVVIAPVPPSPPPPPASEPAPNPSPAPTIPSAFKMFGNAEEITDVQRRSFQRARPPLKPAG